MPRKLTNNRFGKRANHFFNHDNRRARVDDDHPMNFGGVKHRLSFKNSRFGKDRVRHVNSVTKAEPEDPMFSRLSVRKGMFKGKCSRLNSMENQHPRLSIENKVNFKRDPQWFKIMINYGDKYEKDCILSSLLSSMVPHTFIPIMYQVIGHEAIFYVDSKETADKLAECNKKITMSDNYKLQVRVHPGFPKCEADSVPKEKLQAAMAKRYNQQNNSLDLSCFYHDPDLVEDYFCALFRPRMLMTVLEIVADAIPNLEALNLGHNKLFNIEKLSFLEKKLKHLKILYIGDNKIRKMNQMDAVKDLPLEELRLAGNPLVQHKYKERTDDYISDVRQKFPKLLRLDGMELPKQIVFDIAEEDIQLPLTQRAFAKNAEILKVAEQFVLQYLTIFDSDSRQPLLDAYHEHAFFSLTVAQSPTIQKFKKYLSDNRNLFRCADSNRRMKLLKQGRQPVLSFISELPKTQHYLNSFTMDTTSVSASTIIITMTGLFKEVEAEDHQICYFDRTFVIVKFGNGYCIKNEQLNLARPTPSQERLFINGPQTTIANQAAAIQAQQETQQSQPQLSTSEVPTQPTEELQRQMTVALSGQTKMNLEWSFKCLQEVQWNFETAICAFNQFFQAGKIPAEAFSR
ncbi:GSCOCG00004329001-RA-CDS [Cotesia congregata]|uniref:Similar to sbr: Nuclear RNA export factor 1 (Drosophila melanogaster) n=1 Tax=Cotesia congregata TaxID=51543 RepID=A0A8J2H5R5_COTCN|nr:GSCOCG00004329001-RA-CDS [Cotesia congregata]CAG5075568.1 Similar to sbr: Nuclear RNA export factor 1 (Drosophila melanogaster) [Cotesia congregata]